MAFLSNINPTDLPLVNDPDCKLPWEDFGETSKDSNVGIVLLIVLLLTLFFDTFLVATILLHDDLRKKARISGHILEVVIFSHFRGSTFS